MKKKRALESEINKKRRRITITYHQLYSWRPQRRSHHRPPMKENSLYGRALIPGSPAAQTFNFFPVLRCRSRRIGERVGERCMPTYTPYFLPSELRCMQILTYVMLLPKYIWFLTKLTSKQNLSPPSPRRENLSSKKQGRVRTQIPLVCRIILW